MRTKIFAVTVMVVFLAGTVAFAEMAGLPSDQSLVKSGGDWSGEVTIRTDKVGGALVEVPIASSQSGTPRLYRSYARASNNVWAQSTDGKYEIATKASAGYAKADLVLGQGIYRVRMWGKVGKAWMFINQASEFCRADAKGDPAYEFIVNTTTGEVMPVPNDYPAWD